MACGPLSEKGEKRMNAFTTKDGATLMLAAPTIAIDQPLKIVVRKTLMGRFGLHTTVPTTFNSARICRGTSTDFPAQHSAYRARRRQKRVGPSGRLGLERPDNSFSWKSNNKRKVDLKDV